MEETYQPFNVETDLKNSTAKAWMRALALCLFIIGITTGVLAFQVSTFKPSEATETYIAIQQRKQAQLARKEQMKDFVQTQGADPYKKMSREDALRRAKIWSDNPSKYSSVRPDGGSTRPFSDPSDDDETGLAFPIDLPGYIYYAWNLPMNVPIDHNKYKNKNGEDPFLHWPPTKFYPNLDTSDPRYNNYPVSIDTIRFHFAHPCEKHEMRPGDLMCDYGFCAILKQFNQPQSYEDIYGFFQIFYISSAKAGPDLVEYPYPFSVNPETKEYWIWSVPTPYCMNEEYVAPSDLDDEYYRFAEMFVPPHYQGDVDTFKDKDDNKDEGEVVEP